MRILEDDSAGPQRRMIGTTMPSAESLATTTKLTKTQAELREAENDLKRPLARSKSSYM